MRLSDLGFNIEHIVRRFPDTELGESDSSNTPKIIYDYYQLTSEQMLIPQSVVGAIQKKWPAPETSPILTYLANGNEVTSLERKPGEESREDLGHSPRRPGEGRKGREQPFDPVFHDCRCRPETTDGSLGGL